MLARPAVIENLPDEVLLLIFSSLPSKALLSMFLVNHRFKNVALDNVLWQRLFIQCFPHLRWRLEASTGKLLELFRDTYKQQYAKLTPHAIRLFSLIKQENVEGFEAYLKQPKRNLPKTSQNKFTAFFSSMLYSSEPELTLKDISSEDASGLAITPLARKQPHQSQALLNIIYEWIKQKYAESEITKDEQGRTILHWAILCKQTKEAIDALVNEEHFDPDAVTVGGETLLHLAVLAGDESMVEHILSHYKGDYRKANIEGVTSLAIAICHHKNELIPVFFKHPQQPPITEDAVHSFTPLHAAVKSGNVEALKLLFEHDPDCLDYLSVNHYMKSYGASLTPLCYAIVNKNKKSVKVILKFAKARIEETVKQEMGGEQNTKEKIAAKDKRVKTWMHSVSNYTSGVDSPGDRLGSALINDNLNELHDLSPLQVAVKMNAPDIVRLLLQYQADAGFIPHKPAQDKTPLMLAVKEGYTDVIKVLIEYDPGIRANINAYNIDGDKNPLIIAAKKKNRKIVELLVHAGADVDCKIDFKFATSEITVLISEMRVRKMLTKINTSGTIREQAIEVLNKLAPENTSFFPFSDLLVSRGTRLQRIRKDLEMMQEESFNQATFLSCVEKHFKDTCPLELKILMEHVNNVLARQEVLGSCKKV